ncbi:MAG: ThuA domain-containing protein [Rubripirellula sp.]|nr:ThuA domain-containing protein [Rubripirellula sp.]
MMRSRCSDVLLFSLFVATAFGTNVARAQEADEKSPPDKGVRALMVTGGCCHDYQNQKRIISEGLSQRVGPVAWTIVEYGTKRDIKAEIYRKGDWIKGFDIVVHNECFGGVEDGSFVKGIVDAHIASQVPAIVIHCSMHSYRNAPTADTWRAFLGVTSKRHEKKKRSLKVLPTDAGRQSSMLAAIGASWDTPNGELYIIEKVWPRTKVLAEVQSDETGKAEPVIWTNVYKGTRVFGISLGHHNETIQSDVWQDVVAAGWKWSLGN